MLRWWLSGKESSLLQYRKLPFNSWVGKIPWRRDRLPTPAFLGFPGGPAGDESAYNMGDMGSIPELGRSLGEGNSCPLQYSGLENSMDCIVHGVAELDMTEQLSFSLLGSLTEFPINCTSSAWTTHHSSSDLNTPFISIASPSLCKVKVLQRILCSRVRVVALVP